MPDSADVTEMVFAANQTRAGLAMFAVNLGSCRGLPVVPRGPSGRFSMEFQAVVVPAVIDRRENQYWSPAAPAAGRLETARSAVVMPTE